METNSRENLTMKISTKDTIRDVENILGYDAAISQDGDIEILKQAGISERDISIVYYRLEGKSFTEISRIVPLTKNQPSISYWTSFSDGDGGLYESKVTTRARAAGSRGVSRMCVLQSFQKAHEKARRFFRRIGNEHLAFSEQKLNKWLFDEI